VTNRFKARVLSAIGVALGGSATAHQVACGSYWWLKTINVVIFACTVAIAGVTWWATRAR
jgi:hypothetical protein